MCMPKTINRKLEREVKVKCTTKSKSMGQKLRIQIGTRVKEKQYKQTVARNLRK